MTPIVGFEAFANKLLDLGFVELPGIIVVLSSFMMLFIFVINASVKFEDIAFASPGPLKDL